MKVVRTNPVSHKSISNNVKSDKNDIQKNQIKELSAVTPDYAVRTPQVYKSLGVSELSNGLNIYSYKLANGYRVTIVPMEGSPAVVKNYVNVGSMNETDDIKGISHFLEHMAFNGTNGENGYIKLNVGDSFKKIDKLGGWTNASTNYALTDYVNSTPMLEEKDLEEQIKIIAGMTEDLALTPEMIEKEKGPVCSEINMILDNPQTIVMDQTVRSLFNIKSSADELVGGSTEHIKNLTREKVKEYYDKYYIPTNMNLVITGDVDPQKAIELVSKNFQSNKKNNAKIYEEKLEPITTSVRKDFITDKATSTEIMLGFAGPKNNDIKSNVIFDIVSHYLETTKAGLSNEFNNINAYVSSGKEKISTNPNQPSLLYYSINCSEDKSEEALKIFYDKISTLKSPDNKLLENLKEKQLKDFNRALEHSVVVNDFIGRSLINSNIEEVTEYENVIKSITPEDIDNFINKYFDLDKVAVTLVHPPTSQDKIEQNYTNAKKISFKGGIKRQPLNMEKVREYTLENNYKLALLESKNDNVFFDITLNYEKPVDLKPGTREILNEIYSMGTSNLNEEEFMQIKEDNNLSVNARLTPQRLIISGEANNKKFNLLNDYAQELLYRPRITKEEFEKAKTRIKDYIERNQDSAVGLYIDYESKNNPLYTAKKDLRENIDSITLEDVQKLHDYIIKNSYGSVVMNIPKGNNISEQDIKKTFEELQAVKNYVVKYPKVYKPNEKTVVLTKDKNLSQADIMQTYKFKTSNTAKEDVMLDIVNTLLTSSSIGLFNTLREKEHLAYSVYSDTDTIGDSGEISCHILTTTDNKDINEISYDNVQKSIAGFNRQINELKNSSYTDEDLESAKRILKSKLLNNEGTVAKLNALANSIETLDGKDYINNLYSQIDKITREDIDNYTKEIFAGAPIYSIVASKDTLNANKEFFRTLEQ